MNKPGVYQIKNIRTSNVYIGSSSNIARRWLQHKSSLNLNKHENQYLQNAWNKYGKNAFEFSVLVYAVPDQMIKIEQYFLDKYSDISYNILKSAGTSTGYVWSEEAKDKIKGKNNFTGKKHSIESIEKIKAANTGKKRSKETKDKLKGNKNCQGRKLTQEHIDKLIQSRKSLECRNKISEANRIRHSKNRLLKEKGEQD